MEHIDLRSLINKCISGQMQIGRPIMLTSKDRTETTTITFLNHLMKYNGIKSDKLFTFYFQVLNMFNKVFKELMKHSSFNSYIQHVKKEWDIDIDKYILYEERVELDDTKQTIEELLENMNLLCKQFRGLNGRVKTNNMNDVLVEDEMMEHMDVFLEKVGELSLEIDDISKMLNQISENIDGLNMFVLLDLSMKDKSLYLQFSQVDDDVKILDNINISFINYIYIINLIKKHIVYYRRIISKVTEISSNMSKYVENSKDTVRSKDNLLMLNTQQLNIDNYLEELGKEMPQGQNIQNNGEGVEEDVEGVEEDVVEGVEVEGVEGVEGVEVQRL